MIYAAVLAGGSGTRMRADRPKQFLEFGGKPVIIHTVERFMECDGIDRIIVMTPAGWCGYTGEILADHFGKDQIRVADPSRACSVAAGRITVAAGGSTRNETLMNAIAVIEGNGDLDDETIIVTHDAVRPFVTDRMIRENIQAAKNTGACETAFPATDTIIETDDNRYVTEVPDRSRLWMVQTPQSFRAMKLRDLYMSLSVKEKEVLTDAAGIYVRKGEPVEIVKGESSNIKITYPQDIAVAEAIFNALHA